MLRRAHCQAASEPASPAPMILTRTDIEQEIRVEKGLIYYTFRRTDSRTGEKLWRESLSSNLRPHLPK
jgi:hypothetical protein